MKKKYNILLLVFAILLSFTFESCKKYEEGPSISFRSRKTRLAKKWKIATSYKNGETYTPLETEQDSMDNSTYEFKEDNTYHSFTTLTRGSTIMTRDITYDWTFDSNNENILLTNGTCIMNLSYINGGNAVIDTSDQANIKFEILKLKNEEIKLKNTEADIKGDLYSADFIISSN